ncbi:dynein regulatory complex protein 11 [Trichonephila inaurata madagascariensis]|uniref:Dynein regulatory complex protein 11 n=1 Tax=Trichonephila inaurata madagascariensis TaxID=2747483 RepID=A0A8X6MMC5_9ARAC|nr:dynein regulatory complex protein 11 [Trichonephila inaurata madagascariensis]
MTNKTYNELWKLTQEELGNILELENLDETIALEQERLTAMQKTSNLYLRYIQISNRLSDCHKNILQPQKRRLLQKLVDNCIGRALELKHELVGLEFSEVHYLDDLLLEMKLVPDQMNIKIPAYFYEKSKEEQEKLSLIKELLRYLSNDDSNKYWEALRMTEKEAVRLIQIHEQARQGREAFLEAQRLFEIKEENRLKECRKNMKSTISNDLAATRIQRQPSVAEKSETYQAFQRLEELKKNRQALILKNEDEFLETIKEVQKEVETYFAPKAMEDLQMRIRSYFEKYRETNGEYPTFPTDEEGGSAAMLKEIAPIDSEHEKVKTEAVVKEKVISDKKDPKEAKDDEEPTGYILKTSKYVPELMELAKEYDKVWKDKEIIGIFDKCDVEMIRQEAFQEMEISVRLQTDRIMREELHRLTEAFEKDLGKKGKKGGKKGRKKGGKKEKGKGKGKGKKEKDLTPNRSFESLVEELIKEKIIVDYPKFLLSDFIGDYNYVGSVPDVESDPEKDAMPCLGDIRRILNEYCILPMGSAAIHSKGAYVKSILITGPPGVGKKSLIYAICNEIGATLMDLSAKNVNGKYPGKEGLDMLMHLVFKVGRLAQPTIIYISDAENYFWKKQPTNSILVEAIRLKKELPKLIKGISNDDRIMIIGTTVAPFDVDLKALSSYYSKIICILAPDHNCRRALWSEMILKNKGIITSELGLSTLCGVSDGFTAQHIKYAVKKVLTDRRLSLQSKIPLSASEFVHFLSDCTPISQEENEEYRAWLAKMPLQKKRVKVLKDEAGEIIEDAKNKEKSSTKVP